MSKIKALIGNRATKQMRPRMRYGFILDPDLHSQWVEAVDELDELPEFNPELGTRERLNGRRVALQKRVDELEQLVAGVTAVALFQARTADEMEDLRSGWDAENLTTPQRARGVVLSCFVRFEEDGEPVEDAGLEDLAALLPNLSQGELYGISTPLANLSNAALDLPKSMRQYIETRNSAMNSKPA